MVAALAGCSGYEEARRSAVHLASAADAYLQEVDRQIGEEQRFFEAARSRQAGKPQDEMGELVEEMMRDDRAALWPADFYGRLVRYNDGREQQARARAAERAEVWNAYRANLSELQRKRSELVRLRAAFESLVKEISIDARVAYLERLANHARQALQRDDP